MAVGPHANLFKATAMVIAAALLLLSALPSSSAERALLTKTTDTCSKQLHSCQADLQKCSAAVLPPPASNCRPCLEGRDGTKQLVDPVKTKFTIRGKDGYYGYAGDVYAPQTAPFFQPGYTYQLTRNQPEAAPQGASGTLHIIGSDTQAIHNYKRFQLSFNFRMAGAADALWFQCGTPAPPPYPSEDAVPAGTEFSPSQGVKVVMDIFLYDDEKKTNKVVLIDGSFEAARTPKTNPFGDGLWHTMTIDYEQGSARDDTNRWRICLDGKQVLDWEQTYAAAWREYAGPAWFIGARTGTFSADIMVSNVKLLVKP